MPIRGKWKNIGPGVATRKKFWSFNLKGYEYTDIKIKTRHSGEAIMRYVKDFARILVLTKEGYKDEGLRILTGLSEETIREYKELIETYSTKSLSEK